MFTKRDGGCADQVQS